MTATQFIAMLNEASKNIDAFVGGTVTVLAEDGKKHFVNNVLAGGQIINGVTIPTVDANGKAVRTWVLGKEMNARQ